MPAAANTTYCWGDGAFGELGDGQAGTSYAWPLPVPVVGAPEFASVVAGSSHTCALTAAGKAYCWGSDLYGQLGTDPDTVVSRATPAPVLTDLAFSTIDLGQKFTCGLAGGRAYCWGIGETGQLGSGSNDSSLTPVAVAGGHTFTDLAVGQAHACGLTPDGQAWCWGDGYFNQLGAGTTAVAVEPVRVSGGHTFAAITAGAAHTCALLAQSKQAMCWGNNAEGQLGISGSSMAAAPAFVSGNMSFSAINAGDKYTCATVVSMSEAYCWGANGRGQLGNNAKDESAYEDATNEPVRVAGSQKFLTISAGGAHTCAVDSQAAAWCWGEGVDGQLGTGTKGRVATYEDYGSTIPVPVSGGLPFYSVSAGGTHTCGISPRAATPSPSPSPAASPSSSPESTLSPAAPQPSPSPAVNASGTTTPPSDASSSSSSFPVGAVVGAVAGVAVVAVLAFFALRPGKGWLRSKKVPPELPPAEVASESKPSSLGKLTPIGSPPASLLSSLPSLGSSGGTSAAGGALPWSYLSSAGPLQLKPGSPVAPENDPLLSYINSYVASRPRLSSHASTSTPALATSTPPASRPASGGTGPSSGSGGTATSGSGGSGSGVVALSPDAQMWQLEWIELEIRQVVGRGSFGAVYRATWQETAVAVKVLFDKDTLVQRGELQLPEDTMRELQAEAAVMIRIRHPNVVQFLGLCTVPPALVTEYCARGSLYDCLQAAKAGGPAAAALTWTRRLNMAIDAGTGLLYLHSRNIVHRDVKSPNFLCDQHWVVKISDFNLSKLLGSDSKHSILSSGGPSNPIWLAPELMRGGHATTASDVFSFGVVLWELLTWRLPWAGSGLSPFQIGAKVVAGERLEVPPRQALPGPDTATFAGLGAYCALLQECWAGQPEQRPGMAQVVRRLKALLEACGAGGAARLAAAIGSGAS